ncbi:MAG: HesA/MoeB/ThiF family protein [Treponema sp.]|nr:HesA/MoeB/ThiF family protein [Treponema sp.]
MYERYARQIIIPQIGEEGQNKLAGSSVIVVGAGGLGSPALTYLAAAGVGRLGIVDHDTIAINNLNRQFLYDTSGVGHIKVESAKERLTGFNDEIKIEICNERLTGKNAENILTGYDIALGAVDSFETRFIINKACAALCIPYIDGGITSFSGCVLFSYPPCTPCLNCIFPAKTSDKNPPGVFGATAGIIGTIEANLALLWLLKLPNPAENKLILYDGLSMSFDFVEIKRGDGCAVCGGKT